VIQRQTEPGPQERPQFYAYCARKGCGVCGPIRRRREDAEGDSAAHDAVCSSRRKHGARGD
jgi:hypothetical protein